MLSTAMADIDGFATAIGVPTESMHSTVLPLTVCTRGREIAGSDRTAANPCSHAEFGSVCEYTCTNGQRASGPHVCQSTGEFSGGRCGRRPVPLSRDQCPSAWEQLDLSLACDSSISFSTEFRQAYSSRNAEELWSFQYWSQCNPTVAMANVLPISCGVGGRDVGDANNWTWS